MNEMQEIFSPRVRDKAIHTTCSNLIMAGILLPSDVAGYMADITHLDNWQLAEQLIASRQLYDNNLEQCANQPNYRREFGIQ